MHFDENPSPLLQGFCIESLSEQHVVTEAEPLAPEEINELSQFIMNNTEALSHDESIELSFDFLGMNLVESPPQIP